MDWQKMFANGATEKSLVSKIYEQLILLNNNNNKNKEPNWKMGRRSKYASLQIRNTHGQLTHEKVLNITNY